MVGVVEVVRVGQVVIIAELAGFSGREKIEQQSGPKRGCRETFSWDKMKICHRCNRVCLLGAMVAYKTDFSDYAVTFAAFLYKIFELASRDSYPVGSPGELTVVIARIGHRAVHLFALGFSSHLLHSIFWLGCGGCVV